MKKISVRFNGTFESHSIKRDGTVMLGFKAPLSEIASMVNCVRFIDKRVSIGIKAGDERFAIGNVVLNRLSFDKDGEARLMLMSDVENMKLSSENFIALVDIPVRVYLTSVGGA